MEYIEPQTIPGCWEEWNLREGGWPLEMWKEIKDLRKPGIWPLENCQILPVKSKDSIRGLVFVHVQRLQKN